MQSAICHEVSDFIPVSVLENGTVKTELPKDGYDFVFSDNYSFPAVVGQLPGPVGATHVVVKFVRRYGTFAQYVDSLVWFETDGNRVGGELTARHDYVSHFTVYYHVKVCECVCRRQQHTSTVQNLQLTPFSVTAERDYNLDWQEITPEHNYEAESPVQSFPQYSYRKVQITTVGTVNNTLALPGNSKRLTLIVASSDGWGFSVSDAQAGNVNRQPVRFVGPTTVVLPYRDYGPFIHGEIWVNSEFAASVLNVTEIFELG